MVTVSDRGKRRRLKSSDKILSLSIDMNRRKDYLKIGLYHLEDET